MLLKFVAEIAWPSHVVRALEPGRELERAGGVELEVSAEPCEQVGLRRVLRKQEVVEVLLLVAEIGVAVEVVQRILAGGEQPLVVGRRLRVGQLGEVLRVARRVVDRRNEAEVRLDGGGVLVRRVRDHVVGHLDGARAPVAALEHRPVEGRRGVDLQSRAAAVGEAPLLEKTHVHRVRDVGLVLHPGLPVGVVGVEAGNFLIERLALLRAPDVVVHASDLADARDVVRFQYRIFRRRVWHHAQDARPKIDNAAARDLPTRTPAFHPHSFSCPAGGSSRTGHGQAGECILGAQVLDHASVGASK